MKPNYIYVAKDYTTDETLRISFVEMVKKHYRQQDVIKEGWFSYFIGGMKIKEKDVEFNIKKGEQKRIPLPVELAETV